MRSSHTLLTGTTAATTHTTDRHRVTAISWTARVVSLLDALIDRAHRQWPTDSGVLHLPTGESMFIPRHRPVDPACHPDHTGYYQTRIRPNCAATPIPQQRGTGRLRPLVLDIHCHDVAHGATPIARYTLDLRTGDLVIDLPSRNVGPV